MISRGFPELPGNFVPSWFIVLWKMPSRELLSSRILSVLVSDSSAVLIYISRVSNHLFNYLSSRPNVSKVFDVGELLLSLLFSLNLEFDGLMIEGASLLSVAREAFD